MLSLKNFSLPDLDMDARRRLGLAAAAASLLIFVSGTVSYMVDMDRLNNTFTTGGLKLVQTETEWDSEGIVHPDGRADGWDMYPGYCRLKNPSVQNVTGKRNNHAWVRVQMDILGWDKESKSYELADPVRDELIFYTLRYDAAADGEKGPSGTAYPETGHYSASEVESLPCINPDYVMLEDTMPGRHVFYLKKPLKSGAEADAGEVSTLFTHVMLPKEWGQDELDVMGDYKVSIIMDGVQQHTIPKLTDAAGYFGDSGNVFTPGSLTSKNGDGKLNDGFMFSGLLDALDGDASTGNRGVLGSGTSNLGGSGKDGLSSGDGDAGSTSREDGMMGTDSGSDTGGNTGTDGDTHYTDTSSGSGEDCSKAGLIRRGQELKAAGSSADKKRVSYWQQDVRSFVQTNPWNLGDTVNTMYDALYDFQFRGEETPENYDKILAGLEEMPEEGIRY